MLLCLSVLHKQCLFLSTQKKSIYSHNPFLTLYKDLTVLQPQFVEADEAMRLTFPGLTFRILLYLFIVFCFSNSLVSTHSQLQQGTAGNLRPQLTEGYAGKLHFAKTKRDFR